MIIELTKSRRLSSDGRQFTLDKLRIVKEQEIWTPYMFFNSLRQAAKVIPQQLLKESTAVGVKEILLVLRQTERKLLQALGE